MTWICPKCDRSFTESNEPGYNPYSNLCPECQKTRTEHDLVHEPATDTPHSNAVYYLQIFIHAHHTGNSVPPHLEAEARKIAGIL